MSLNIFLYKHENFKETIEKENLYNQRSKFLWDKAGDQDGLTEDQIEDIRKEIEEFAFSLGLSRTGNDESNKFRIEENSKKYPDHYFKIGYFRSSHNGSGIQKVLKNMNLFGLDWVFNKDQNQNDYFLPQWELAKTRIQILRNQFSQQDPYRVIYIPQNSFEFSAKSETDALSIVKNQLQEKKNSNNGVENYSTIDSEFYLYDPLQVVAIIPGKYTVPEEAKYNKEINCVYIVSKSDNSWYEKALEIVEETIDWVLCQQDQEKYRIYWSS